MNHSYRPRGRVTLLSWTRSSSIKAGFALRARIVLAAVKVLFGIVTIQAARRGTLTLPHARGSQTSRRLALLNY